MKQHIFLIVGIGLMLAACAEKEETVFEAADEPVAPAAEVAPPPAMDERWRNAGFLKHMHRHAEKPDDLNFALTDGDLERARTPAYWLAKHETYDDIQSEWLSYLYAMRSEAEAVEAAADLETTRAAAERITIQCQACDAADGMSPE